ncbi:UPF0496 protein 1 isoform X1 [Selaginella moellendorffii]|uniref:UPF0496 protein 1 isoform X1 n=1 Tax=Selaginella moellendorffii TaxID=88036 RepID=UPI000D1D0DD0|nr:UPF0496 protein 1 isoform X1 [Selaginella moellendorffii]|eukprot:XP_024544707.1 UPF0496 protein 1 isoform X1 [Selaginella moellendorffii]
MSSQDLIDRAQAASGDCSIAAALGNISVGEARDSVAGTKAPGKKCGISTPPPAFADSRAGQVIISKEQQQVAPMSASLKPTHVWSAVSRWLRWQGGDDNVAETSVVLDVEQEYQRAIRTDSYVEFAERVAVARLNRETGTSVQGSVSPMPRSFERLAAALLEPEEDKILALLTTNKELGKRPEIHQLVSEYLEESRKSSALWASLLKSIQSSRDRCQEIGGILKSQTSDQEILRELCSIDEGENLFSVAVVQQFQPLHDHCLGMQKKLDKIRKKVGKKLRLTRACLKVSTVILSIGCFIVLLVTTLALFLAVAALVVGCKVFTFPIGYVVRRLNLRKRKKLNALERQWRQVEAVSQGTFVVVQDLDTTRRLVMRLGSEIDFTNKAVAFSIRHREDRSMLSQSLERLRRNQMILSQLLDDLEVNIYLSFMSINNTRREVCRQ